jgi:hypothetical protein
MTIALKRHARNGWCPVSSGCGRVSALECKCDGNGHTCSPTICHTGGASRHPWGESRSPATSRDRLADYGPAAPPHFCR